MEVIWPDYYPYRKNSQRKVFTNTNPIIPFTLSLRGAERRSNPMKNEIATPFGLAMTTDDVKIFNAFLLDSEKVRILITTTGSTIEHERMSTSLGVWVT
jgi:hypothetical protein